MLTAGGKNRRETNLKRVGTEVKGTTRNCECSVSAVRKYIVSERTSKETEKEGILVSAV